ncbi:MAG TPA: C4-type zinc ribbon domain-containing protein [Acidimicrobiales bacterium]
MSDTDDLRALTEADRWIDRVSAQRTHLPEITELAALEAELRGLLKNLHEAEEVAAPVKAAFERVAQESTRLKTRASDLDARLATSTANARELAAIQAELTHVRELLGASEERELELLLDLEPREDEIASIKLRAQPGVARRGELLGIIDELQASLEDELVALRASRDQRASELSSALSKRYDAALARVGTSGAANVIEGRCDGCRLALSPLDFDRWKSHAPDTFMDCPECGRLLLP